MTQITVPMTGYLQPFRTQRPDLSSDKYQAVWLYLHFLPSSYSEDLGPWPLVLDFHGFTMTAEEQRQYSKWDVLAEEEGFIAVFPEGVPDSPSELRNTKTDGCWEFKQTFRSWNINDDSGIFGDVCDRDR